MSLLGKIAKSVAIGDAVDIPIKASDKAQRLLVINSTTGEHSFVT